MIEAFVNNTRYFISYSSTGQPSIYFGREIEYNMRDICVIENEDYYVEYYYNANGIRIGKSIDNGSTVELVNYILDESNIIREIHTGTNYYTLEYYYDLSDNIIGFTYNGNKYLYLKNLQNDIVGILDSNNNIVVKYYYDAYGRIIKTLDTSGINLSSINPFRYKSYYQDNETDWYYLNSRYYNPIVNRFIKIDQIEYLGYSGSLLSYNLYSYCENNPICLYDKNGTDAIYVVDFDALPVVGHALLYYQYMGTWYKTEFTGTKKKNARVYNKELIYASKNSIINSLGKKELYVYIKGNFNNSYNYANKCVKNYNKYNLFINNCLHYVKNVLKEGKISNTLMNLYIRNSTTIVPHIFYLNASISNSLKNNWFNRILVRGLA